MHGNFSTELAAVWLIVYSCCSPTAPIVAQMQCYNSVSSSSEAAGTVFCDGGSPHVGSDDSFMQNLGVTFLLRERRLSLFRGETVRPPGMVRAPIVFDVAS